MPCADSVLDATFSLFSRFLPAMVFRSRNRPAEERSKRPADFDLLTTLFGLPNRHTLECDERQRARRVVLSYVTDGHQHVGVQQDGRDSSEGESESESESESLEAGPGRLADSDLATDDDYGHVESRQVTVKIPRRASMKKTPKHHERRQDLDAIPVKSHQTKKLEKKNLKPRKQHRDKSVSEGSKASEVSRASQISPPPSSSATSIPTTRGRKSRRASANGVTSTLGPQLHFVPQPPFELPIQSVVQNPISLQPQQQLPPPQGYYHQPSFAYPGGVDASMMAPTSAPVPFQQWSDAGYLPHPNGVLSGLGHDATPQPEKSGPLNNAEEVKKIQAQIDRVVAQLQQNPRGTKLNTKMKSLQVLLNEALNKATAHQSQGKKPSHSQPPSEEKQIQTSKSKPLGNSQKDCSDESRKSSEASVLGSSRGEASTVVGGEGRTHLHHQRANSLTGDSPRHRCYNCGNSRSMWYHERYPIETSRRARNLCENCRDDLLRGGIVGQRHYCCGCGRARSSNFHRKNPAIPGDALLLSHCRNCEDEMRTADGTTNASVGDSVSFLIIDLAVL